MVDAKEFVAHADEAARQEELEERVIDMLRTIYDPEIPVNIYELGLIYELDVESDGAVQIRMTLTAPGCPVAQSFPGIVRDRLMEVEGVTDVKVELVWEPPWSREFMSDEARMQLDML
ncbi:MAG: SUF system Fe-S cluster assembly protein [Pseudomonadota bacterium]